MIVLYIFKNVKTSRNGVHHFSWHTWVAIGVYDYLWSDKRKQFFKNKTNFLLSFSAWIIATFYLYIPYLWTNYFENFWFTFFLCGISAVLLASSNFTLKVSPFTLTEAKSLKHPMAISFSFIHIFLSDINATILILLVLAFQNLIL